ncbi:MAG TPA: tyrosine-type recombinase/integrase [Solirubrobacteraceae bacterium]|nr:tyrosine-type recombinase/integrase [Solirubrobacteraceae bacterium]
MSKGITIRHQRKCARDPCTCKPRFQAEAYDRRTGRRLRRTFKTISGARQWRSDAITAIRRGELTTDLGPTLQEAVDEWLAGARLGHVTNRSGDPYKPAAIRGYEASLRLRVLPTLGPERLREIRHPDLQRLVDRLVTEGHAPATIMGSVTPLRALYRRAITRGVATVNPTRGLELPAVRSKPRRYLDPREADQLLAGLTGTTRALWATALYAGLRRGELVALKWENVDLAAGLIRVEHGWDAVEGEIAPKIHRGRRSVPVPAILRDVLVEHRVWSGATGRVYGPPRAVRRMSETVTDLTLHDARHTYASLMIAAGVNAKALSTFMGHANIAVTMDLYGHLMPGAEDEAADLFDAYLARAAGGTIPDPTAAIPAAHPDQAPA